MMRFLLLALCSSLVASHPLLKDLPDAGGEWVSLPDGSSSFQPASSNDRALRAAQQRFLGQSVPYVDGSETYYDDYAQAWRMLGFYIDCSKNQNWNGEQDGGDGANNYGCRRYLLWAAYIDLNYSGGGIGEYQYFDRKNNRWDRSACRKHGNGRCAKMDCHLPGTHYSLLGYFKEADYDEWMEQLFKHEGVCVWTDAEYALMQKSREAWPLQCTQSYSTDENGNTIYFDLKPTTQGGMTIGMYTDYRCSKDYLGSKVNLETALYEYYEAGGNRYNDDDYYYDSTYSLASHLDKWNDAFDIFHYCQPCKAYNLGYIPSNQYTDDGRNYELDNEDDTDDANESYFSCYDDANYRNVNQCMKFRTKTTMYTASFNDVLLGVQQGSIRNVDHNGLTYMSTASVTVQNALAWIFFFASCLVFALGLILLLRAIGRIPKNSPFVEPLVAGGIVA